MIRKSGRKVRAVGVQPGCRRKRYVGVFAERAPASARAR
jgi:hypothetical protein